MGFLSKILGGKATQEKPAKSKVVKVGDWEVHIEPNGAPTQFYKKGREWLHSDRRWRSPSGSYFLHTGHDGNADECIALTTQTEGLKLKKTDEGIEDALVLDNGVAYAISSDCVFFQITRDKASQRQLCEERLDAYILTPQICAVAFEEDTEVVTVRAVDLTTGKAWKKSIKYTWPETGDNVDISVVATGSGISVTTPDGSSHNFTTAGSPL